ncbi:DUF262 domain-containing protein [Pectobacterium sp. CHL-2024]|uniref:DUF262 domain-containing protein n=1 Tax=Pectobacterium sp. CHL-2024 TaxID=3377079 RepID=UPI003821AB30
MKPFSRSAIELFDGTKRYVIPMFQRQYVWREEKQLARLWSDLQAKTQQRLDRKITSPHFLGAIVIANLPTYGRQVQTYDVIDGQQRLTTFQILLTAFRDVAKYHNSEYADELNKYIVNVGIMEDKAVERYKVWPTQVDRPQMKALVDSGSLTAVAILEQTSFDRRKTGVEPFMFVAYKYFYQQTMDFVVSDSIDSTKDERIEALFDALKRDLALVSIELEGGDDPQVIFETLNGFNEPLLPTDLLRNFAFQRAYREQRGENDKSPDELYNDYWLQFDQHFWKKDEKQGRLKRPRADIFFQHFLAMKLASDVNVARLYHDYKVWIETKAPYSCVEDELKDLEKFARVFKKLLSPDEPSELSAFAFMLNAFDVKTIYPLILFLCCEVELEGESLVQALAILESFLIRRAVCCLTTKNYNRLFLQLVETLRGKGDVVEALRTALLHGSGDAVVWPDDVSFKQSWRNRPLYSDLTSSRVQYILKHIEQAKRTTKNEDIHIRSPLTIEHIMPVAWETNWPLADGSFAKPAKERLEIGESNPEAEQRTSIINSIGNLTLLTHPLNSSLRNSNWDVKKPEITKQSSLALNRDLLDIGVWNDEEIVNRQEKLWRLAEVLWSR